MTVFRVAMGLAGLTMLGLGLRWIVQAVRTGVVTAPHEGGLAEGGLLGGRLDPSARPGVDRVLRREDSPFLFWGFLSTCLVCILGTAAIPLAIAWFYSE